MLTKTRKWLLAVIALLCTAFIALGVGFALPWAKLFPTKTVQAETATTAVTFTHNGGGAQDDSKRYLLKASESIETSGHTTVKTDVYKNGLFFAEKSFTLHDGGNKEIWVLVPYATLTGSEITTAEQITDTYTIIVKANTKFATSYHVENDIAWSVKGYSPTDMTNIGEVSYGVKSGSSAQNNNKRYCIYHSNTTALTGVNGYYQLPLSISKNGGAATTKRFESYANHSGLEGLTCIPYATLTGSEITTAEGVTDTYTVTLQKGYRIIVDNKIATVGKTIVWTINKYSISGVAYDIEITVKPSSTFSPRANDYYTVVSYDQALGIEGTGSCKVPVEVTKDGDSIGTKQADLWLNGASYTKDNAGFIFTFTNKNEIDGFYTATLKKGTVFTVNGKNVYVKNEVSWFMDPADGTFWTVSNNYGKATLTSGAVTADDAANKYSVTTTSNVDLSKIKAAASLPMLVSKNGGTAETKNFTLSNNGTTTTVAFDYETLLGNKDAVAAEVTDTYTITLKKGTAVRSGANFALIANDVTWTIEPTETDINATATPGVASISADFSRYQAWITTGVDWASYGIVNPEVPFTVSKNGSEAYTLNFVLFNNGDDFKESQLILFEYSRLGSFTSAAENTDTYLITLEAGTQIEKGDVTVTFADTVTWYARGKTFGVVTKDHGEVNFTPRSATSEDGSNRYAIHVQANGVLKGDFNDYNMPLSISKNGEKAVSKVFHVWNNSFDYTDSNTMIEVKYGTPEESANYNGLDGTFSKAADNNDEYIVTLKKGSVIFQNGNLIRVGNEDITWYIFGRLVGVYNKSATPIGITFGVDTVNKDGAGCAKVAAQDSTNGGRYCVWLSANNNGRSVSDLTGITDKAAQIPITVYKNKGRGKDNGEDTFKKNHCELISYGKDGDSDINGNYTVIEILYATLGSTAKAAENTDAYIAVIEAGTPIALTADGTLIVAENDLSIYMSGSVGFVSRGDETVFSTMTSFKLDYTGNTLTDVKMRFRWVISNDVYNYWMAQIDEIQNNAQYKSRVENYIIRFGVEVSNGHQTLDLQWNLNSKNNTVSELVRADTDGDGDIDEQDGYVVSAVIGGLNGHWGDPISAKAYTEFELLLDDTANKGIPFLGIDPIPDIPLRKYYVGQTNYSVNQLAKKYNEMGIYAEDQQLLDYLASNTGL